MADKGFNGTSIVLGTTGATTAMSNVVSCSFTNNAAEVDVSSLSTTTKAYVAGQRDPSCTLRVRGQPQTSVTVGGTTCLSITWNDNTSTPVTQNVVCVGSEVNGDIDGSIDGTLTFKPYVA